MPEFLEAESMGPEALRYTLPFLLAPLERFVEPLRTVDDDFLTELSGEARVDTVRADEWWLRGGVEVVECVCAEECVECVCVVGGRLRSVPVVSRAIQAARASGCCATRTTKMIRPCSGVVMQKMYCSVRRAHPMLTAPATHVTPSSATTVTAPRT